jgi:ribonuclease D
LKAARRAIAQLCGRMFSRKNSAPSKNGFHGLITTPEPLAELVARLAPLERLGLDTEADSLHCYREKLCLIQIGIPGDDLLVDPLAGLDLTGLFQALGKKETILHGADYDLRLLHRAGHTETGKIFDTMIAARLTGATEFSYSALVAQHFGVTLTKGSQKANWALRPLSPVMEQYARNDTRYLIPLAEKLGEQLEKMRRREWFDQSCERAVATAKIVKERDEENAWRIPGSAKLDGRAGAVLRALWHWRDDEARAADRPAFHIFHNEKLVEAALQFHHGQRVDSAHLRGGREKRFFEAAEKALLLDESDWPQRPRGTRTRTTPAEEKRYHELKKKRDQVAEKINLDPSLIAPRATLEQLAADGSSASERLLPWQRQLLELAD